MDDAKIFHFTVCYFPEVSNRQALTNSVDSKHQLEPFGGIFSKLGQCVPFFFYYPNETRSKTGFHAMRILQTDVQNLH